jgi:type VI secretion system secreted protein Hcp
MTRSRARSFLAFSLAALLSNGALAADMFLKLDGVEGELSSGGGGGSGGTLTLDSWSFGASNSGSAHMGGGMGAGRMAAPAAEPKLGSSGALTVTRLYDKASPVLAKHCASGTHFPSAQIRRCENGVCRDYTLSDVTVSSVTIKNDGRAATETLSLNYTKIEWKAAPASSDSAALSSKGGGASVGKPNPGRLR